MAKPKSSSKPKATSKPKAAPKSAPKPKAKAEPKDKTVKWVWVLTIAVITLSLIIVSLGFWIGELYNTIEGNVAEVEKSGVRTVYTELTSWNENGKKALFYEFTLANNSEDAVTSWKYEIETNDSVELKEANECQAFISNNILTIIPKGNSTLPGNNKIKFNVVLLDNGENSISNFTLYVNNEKYSTFSSTTSETTMITAEEATTTEENK